MVASWKNTHRQNTVVGISRYQIIYKIGGKRKEPPIIAFVFIFALFVSSNIEIQILLGTYEVYLYVKRKDNGRLAMTTTHHTQQHPRVPPMVSLPGGLRPHSYVLSMRCKRSILIPHL